MSGDDWNNTPSPPVGLTAEEKAPALAAFVADARINAPPWPSGPPIVMPPPATPIPPPGFRQDIDQTNPKDLVGDTKVPLHLWPPVGTIYGAMGFKDGAQKYGAYNWRTTKVRMTVYLSAIQRHVLALQDGEDDAPDSTQHHLAHILANAALLADAREGGNLIDDRPPAGPGAAVLERFREKR